MAGRVERSCLSPDDVAISGAVRGLEGLFVLELHPRLQKLCRAGPVLPGAKIDTPTSLVPYTS